VELNGTSALVTGGASGIGAACARRLVDSGAQVVVADRDERTGQRVSAELGCLFVPVDITRSDDVAAAVETAAALGPLRSLVNSAGIAWLTRTIGRDGSFSTAHDLDAFRRVLEINTVGTFNCIRLAASAMSQTEPDENGSRGSIVTIASGVAFEGQRGQAAYAASKAALVGLTLPVARDLATVGIRVNTVSPGVVDTPIYGESAAGKAFQDEQVESSVLFPKRAGSPYELASLVLALLTNDYMNAETVRVDGGMRLAAGTSTSWRGVGRT
jgi:NAD(P)-dependent dehydrogenase (short-subunit alcohol dehydrogenase family)